MTTAKHTPTPWTYRQRTTTDDLFIIEGADYSVVRTFSPYPTANAALIIQAVNAHEAMKEAIRSLLELHKPSHNHMAHVAAREALALAEKE